MFDKQPKKETLKEKFINFYWTEIIKCQYEIERNRQYVGAMNEKFEFFKKESEDLKAKITELIKSDKYEDRQQRKELEKKFEIANKNKTEQETEINKTEKLRESLENRITNFEEYLKMTDRVFNFINLK